MSESHDVTPAIAGGGFYEVSARISIVIMKKQYKVGNPSSYKWNTLEYDVKHQSNKQRIHCVWKTNADSVNVHHAEFENYQHGAFIAPTH